MNLKDPEIKEQEATMTLILTTDEWLVMSNWGVVVASVALTGVTVWAVSHDSHKHEETIVGDVQAESAKAQELLAEIVNNLIDAREHDVAAKVDVTDAAATAEETPTTK